MDGSPHTHSHSHSHPVSDERRTVMAFALTASFMVVEAVGGWLAGSLALVADATHMLTDAAALAMAWAAFRLGRMPADSRRSYGYRRFEVIAALVNGLAVVALSLWIVVEAVGRLSDPQPVAGWPMLVVAALGMAVNLLVLRVLGGHSHDHGNLNLRGAVLHVLGDLLGSAAAVAAAIVILVWGWTPIDPILSVGVAGLILWGAWHLIGSASHILLEGTPEGFDADALHEHLKEAVAGVEDIHHIHAWSLTSGQTMLTLHVRVDGSHDASAVLAKVKCEIVRRFGIDHSVVQVERGDCPDHGCG